MPRTFLILSLLALLTTSLSAQKVRKVSAEYQLNLSRSELSEKAACQKCVELAQVQAIEKAFGTVIIQGNTTYIKNEETGEQVETEQTFNMMAETYVNGRWVETLSEDCNRFTEDGEFWVRCKIKGKVRELSQPKLDLTAEPMDCVTANCVTTQFQEGESLYLLFKSPINGYLTVYLSDETTTQRLLPYRDMPDGKIQALPVKADKEYVLFSREKDPFDLGPYVDEYELFAANEQDLNRLYVIFSEKPLRKPSLSRGGVSESSQDSVPLQMKAKDFQRWLAQNRTFQDEFQVERVDILIRKW
ncbi:MAG: hypothetical protein AAGI38_02535 [Bacteroidota bacterium]